MTSVAYPDMRAQVIAALAALADTRNQQAHWGVVVPGVDYYDDLTLNVHILYDDCQVLPDPAAAIATVLYEREVPALRAVHEALGPMLDDLGESPDRRYVADDRWPMVIGAARAALLVMSESH